MINEKSSYSFMVIKHPRVEIDPIALKASKAVGKLDGNDLKIVEAKVKEKAGKISAVTKMLDKERMTNLNKFLLAETYPKTLKHVYVDSGGDPDEMEGFIGDIKAKQEELLEKFVTNIVKEVFKNNFIVLSPENQHLEQKLIDRIKTLEIPIGRGLEQFVMSHFEAVVDQGIIPDAIDKYLKDKKEIKDGYIDRAIKDRMVRYLIDKGVNIDSLDRSQYFDEHYALAYDHAVDEITGADDPIQAKTARGAVSTWDFTSVDYFDDFKAQGISKENCLAAGVLDYCHELGNNMGIFRLADAVVLNWSAGLIDVVGGNGTNRTSREAEAKLYRYWKLMDERMTANERGMVIKRVLNKGETKVLSRMVVDEHFTGLWENLMSEVARYIEKSEKVQEGSRDSSPVSRTPVYQAIQELQHNLTEYCTGMAHMQAREIYAQLQDAIDLLRDPEIVAHFGSRSRKNLWTTIEMISKAEFKTSPNIAAIRTAAVDGNRVFQHIANFDKSTITNNAFQELLEASEAYILAKASSTKDYLDVKEEEGEEFDDFAEDESEKEDEFADF